MQNDQNGQNSTQSAVSSPAQSAQVDQPQVATPTQPEPVVELDVPQINRSQDEPSKPSVPKTKIAAIFGVALLILGVGAGVVLVQRQQLFDQKASGAKNVTASVDCGGGHITNNSNEQVSGLFEQFDPNAKKDFTIGPGESLDFSWQGNLQINTSFMYVVVEGRGRIAGEHYTCGPTPTPSTNLRVSNFDCNELHIVSPAISSGFENSSAVCKVERPNNSVVDVSVDWDKAASGSSTAHWRSTNTNYYSTAGEYRVTECNFTNGLAVENLPFISALDCSKTTSSPAPTPTPQPTLPPNLSAKCLLVKAYTVDNDEPTVEANWTQLSSADLAGLKSGDAVYFTVVGSSTTGNFDSARIKVGDNSGKTPDWVVTTNKKPGSDEFYIKYTVAAGSFSFSVDGQVHYTDLNQWL